MKMRRSLLWAIALVTSALLAGLVGLGLISAEESSSRQFSFSADPAVELLKVRHLGERTGAGPSYTLFADGRLLIQTVAVDNTVFDSTELRLSYEEMYQLLQEAVNAGLMEYDKSQIEEEMGVAARTIITIDGSTMFLEIHLENYQGPDSASPQAASIAIVFKNPTIVAKRHPDIEELQALAAIAHWMKDYRKIAKKESL